MDMNIDNSHSYATEANLVAALKRLCLDMYKPLIVRNRKGRFTAIFSFSLSGVQGDVMFAARHGFITFN